MGAFSTLFNRVRKKGSFWKRGLFGKVHFLEILENLEILEFLEKPPDCGKERIIRPFSRDSRDSRDFCSEKTPFVMTPFSGPDPSKKKDQKDKLLGLDIFGWGGGLPHEGAEVKESRCAPRNPTNKLWGYPQFVLALLKSPSRGGLTKMGSVTFWGPLDTSFLFAHNCGGPVTSENRCV